MHKITRVFPQPTDELELKGAYLSLNLRQQYREQNKPLVYANFVQSLDGRIAVPRSEGGDLSVPGAVSNPRDWRLFQELAAQADVILTTGRYLRDWAAGRAQEILQVDNDAFADLRSWRKNSGLPEHADLAILSASLDFEVPEVLQAGGRKALIFTTENADQIRIEALRPLVSQIIIVGRERVDGALLVDALGKLGYRLIYSAAGPQVLHMLLSAEVLDRLYLTITPRLLGGQKFVSILEGALLNPPASMRIESLYIDPTAFDGGGQLFLGYAFTSDPSSNLKNST